MFSTFLAIVIINSQPQPKPIITPGNSIARKCSRPGGGRACEPRLAGLNNPTQTTVEGADTGFLAGLNNPTQTTVEGADTGFLAGFVPDPSTPPKNATFGSGTRKSLG